jgi:hypothetical protein
MSIQKAGVDRLASRTAALALALVFLIWGCGSSSGGSDGAAGQPDSVGGADGTDDGGEPSSGGTASAGETAVGGGGDGNSAGGAGLADCPLDELARARTEAITMQAINEAGWIVNQTHGVGQFASRGFGFAIPLTTVASILSITLMEECVGPKMFDEYCPPPEASGTESSPCSQLECLGPSELGTTLHFDPVPFSAPLEPPPGDVSVLSASQNAFFTDQEDESIAIEWTTEFQLLPDGETQLTITQTGTATAGAAEVPAMGAIAVDGIVVGREPLQINYSATAAEVTGSGTLEGQEVLTLTHDGVVWSGPCELP